MKLKQLFCRHNYILTRWHKCHWPEDFNPLNIEAEVACKKCGKKKYFHFPLYSESGQKFVKMFKSKQEI